MNIILVHGILGFREKFGIEYLRNIAEHFREKGFTVLAPILDPTQGIEFRGCQRRDQINAAFASGSIDPSQKTHINRPQHGRAGQRVDTVTGES